MNYIYCERMKAKMSEAQCKARMKEQKYKMDRAKKSKARFPYAADGHTYVGCVDCPGGKRIPNDLIPAIVGMEL